MTDIRKVFQRLEESFDESVPDAEDPGIAEWQVRIDNLIFSDPKELLSFISDALVVIAAKAKNEDTGWEDAIHIVDEASNMPERSRVIAAVRERVNQLIAIAEEQTGASKEVVMACYYDLSRKAPWPGIKHIKTVSYMEPVCPDCGNRTIAPNFGDGGLKVIKAGDGREIQCGKCGLAYELTEEHGALINLQESSEATRTEN